MRNRIFYLKFRSKPWLATPPATPPELFTISSQVLPPSLHLLRFLGFPSINCDVDYPCVFYSNLWCTYRSADMMVVPYSVVSSASSFLALGKSAWRIGIALQRLNQNGLIFDIPVRYLTWEVKSLGAECDHVYAELEEVLNTSETGSPYPQDPDNKMWNCLAMQVEEIGRTIQELDQFVGGRRVEETVIVSKAEHQRQETNRISIAGIRECLCRQTQALHTTLLLIKT